MTTLEKNKVNALISDSSGLTFTKTTLSKTDITSSALAVQPASVIAAHDPNLVTMRPLAMVTKNKWIEQFSACKTFTFDLASSCYYYMFYSSNTALLNNNLGTPTSANTCPQSEMFSYQQYPQLSATDKHIRSTCFPFYSEYTSGDIPETPLSKMLSVDSQSFQIKWNNTISQEVVGKSWVYAAEETSDDRQFKGYTANAVFESVGVSNSKIIVTSNQNWSKTLL